MTQVAFHPRALAVAVGYEDGFIMLCRLSDAAEILVREQRPEDGAVTALAWDAIGSASFTASPTAAPGLLALPA